MCHTVQVLHTSLTPEKFGEPVPLTKGGVVVTFVSMNVYSQRR